MAYEYPPLCPSGCFTNHGGYFGTRQLRADWLAASSVEGPWDEYAERHGRPDLADQPAPAAEQEATT